MQDSPLVVFPVGPRDIQLAIDTLTWAIKLESHLPFQSVLVVNHNLPEIELLLGKLFSGVEVFKIETCPYGTTWPAPQNWAWQQVAKRLAELPDSPNSWFWWEPDAIPLKKNWLAKLVGAHKAGGKPFSGSIVKRQEGSYMAGVGFYPNNASKILPTACRIREHPFDVVAGIMDHASVQTCDIGGLLNHRVPDNTRNCYVTTENWHQLIPDESVLFHPSKDGAVIRILSGGKPKPPVVTQSGSLTVSKGKRSTFHHSGDLGDVIYSLPTIRELGGGEITLSPDNRTPMATREKMTPDRAALIIPLLLVQPYIHSVRSSDSMPAVDYDMNQMRILLRRERLDLAREFNLARCYLKTFSLSLDNDSVPWLSVDRVVRLGFPVVINRTTRYRDPNFKWALILEKYAGKVVFVGCRNEHEDFCSIYGNVPFQPTENLLELARVIAGSELFIGNQSCAYAIAEGLKKPAILEACPAGSNTLFARSSVQVGFSESSSAPPLKSALNDKPPTNLRLSIRGPIDGITGLGQLTGELSTALARSGVQLNLKPLRTQKPYLESLQTLLDAKIPKHGKDMVICPVGWIDKDLKLADALLTMWESTVVPRNIVAIINDMASMLIVPTDWNETVFSTSGVRVPIRVVPLGLDPNVFKFSPRKPGEKFTVGCAGRYAHGGIRKGIQDSVTSFLEAFKNRKDVQLRIKLHKDCQIVLPQDPRIEVTRDLLSWPDLVKWYESLDCFLCLSKGEGFGLHALQSMAVGRPVIGPRFSGLGEFHSDQTGWVTGHDLVLAKEGEGFWAQPRLPVNLLKDLADSPMECSRRGYYASQVARSYTWSRMADGIIKAMA